MFFVTVLGSGSAGNCALVETPQTRLLIDGGLSAKQMVDRLGQCGVRPESVDGILLTHEHSDHSGGLDVWCKRYPTPIYCNRDTREVLHRGASAVHKDWRLFVTRSNFSIKDIDVQCFDVPHDAVDPVGFVLSHNGAELGFLTDLGFATNSVRERIRDVQMLVIEANYDPKLLENDTKRPWSVKQRITQRHGHLSNLATADVVSELAGRKLRRTVLGHLSRDCNSPELAIGAVRARLDAEGAHAVEVLCATQREITPRLAVAGA